MKKILLLAVALATSSVYSQEEMKKNSIGLQATGSQISTVGIFHESFFKNDQNKVYSNTFEINYATTTLKTGGLEFSGSGIELRSSLKRFFKENSTTGFFTKSSLAYGNIKFDDTDQLGVIDINYKGTYSYFSFLAPEIGYDFMLGKNLRASLNAGAQWQLEIKGKDDVDNKDFDNWLYRFGLRVSYDF